MITDIKRLSGLQKVAILFNILGECLSITLLKELTKHVYGYNLEKRFKYTTKRRSKEKTKLMFHMEN